MYTSGSCKSDVVYGCTRPRRDNACRLAIRSPHLAGFRRINFPRRGINSTLDFNRTKGESGFYIILSFFFCDVSLRKEDVASSCRLNFHDHWAFNHCQHFAQILFRTFIKKISNISLSTAPTSVSLYLSLLFVSRWMRKTTVVYYTQGKTKLFFNIFHLLNPRHAATSCAVAHKPFSAASATETIFCTGPTELLELLLINFTACMLLNCDVS